MAQQRINAILDDEIGDKKRLMFIKDQSGCGYWRMVVPIRYMNADTMHIDMAEVEIVYEYLLKYDVIVVQRLYSWREFYTVERLKRHGKRIVYDIDDDIFSIPADNPAARVIRRDQMEAAKGIMAIVDKITTTTEILKEKLGFQDKTVVIPNAIDLDDGYQIGYQGQTDEFRRIMWMGSATHEKDWECCLPAVDSILQKYPNTRLVLLGFIPRCIQAMVESSRPWWDGRVEFSGFTDVETYVSVTKQLRVDIALCPLQDTVFNHSKSAIKWMEYSAAGIPTIASNVSPYKEAITNDHDGILVENNPEEWEQAICKLLDEEDLRRTFVDNARSTINEKYDIKKVVHEWEAAIFA